MGKLILAKSPTVFPAAAPPLAAETKRGTVYVIDLVGFSRLTEERVSAGEKTGTEQVTHLVTMLFTQLMAQLSRSDIEFGGFAGDALIAWQTDGPNTLSVSDFQALATRVCDDVWVGLRCRTAQASGIFCVGRIALNNDSRPLVWGPAVAEAFHALAQSPRPLGERPRQTSSHQAPPSQMLATASVSNRWAIILRALTPDACTRASAEDLAQTIAACRVVCDAYSAEIDNLVQDDKGLIIIIVLPQALRADSRACDALLTGLTSGRKPLIDARQATARFGTLFRCRPQFSDQSVAITIGDPINQAVKALGQESPSAIATPSVSPLAAQIHGQQLIGREAETEILRQALSQSNHAPQIATLTGPAGIGKTALTHCVREPKDLGSVHVELAPGSRHLPFGGAQDLAEACGIAANEVFEPSGLTLLARKLPHTVIIENWQWCDDDSKRLIRQLQTDRSAGLLLITSRLEVTDLIAATEIRVDPLNAEQAGQLIESLAPNVLDEMQKRSVFEVSSGAPFWLVQAALHYGNQSRAGDPLANASGLESLLTARAQALSDPAIALWRLHCAWRAPLEFEIARDLLAKFGINVSTEHGEELQSLGWLNFDPARTTRDLRPAHDILADWGVSDLPITFELGLHAQIARALSKQGNSPSRIAHHWQSANQELRAAIWYARAAQFADRAGAHRLTLTHLAQSDALSRGARRSNQNRALQHLALSATANWGVGKLRRAKQDLIEFDAVAKTLPSSSRKRKAFQRAAAIQSEVGQFAGNSNFILSGMYRGWRNRRDAPDAYEVKARRDAFIYYLFGLARLPVSDRFNHLVNRAHARGEYRSEALLGCAAGTLHMSRGEWRAAETVLASCHTAIAQTDDRQMLGVVQCLHALCYLYQGRTDDSSVWFERVAETGREQDHHLFNVWGAYGKAEAQLYAGNIQDAKQNALDAKRKSAGLGDLQSVCIIEGVLARAALIDEDLGGARKHARNAMRFAVKLPPSNFSTLEGIAAAAQVGCGLMARGISDPDLATMIKAGRKALKSYAQVFHIARPRYHYVEALIAQTQDDEIRALKQIEKARIAASRLSMDYEYTLASQTFRQNPERQHDATAKIH